MTHFSLPIYCGTFIHFS